jgi:hypothetical protein
VRLEPYTIGVGDRFAHQAKAQLRACQLAAERGVAVTPVWNKSNREHTFIGSQPQGVFDAAQAAVKELAWTGGWHVDADHIRLDTVDKFLACSDFFTIDVADSIGKTPEERYVERFLVKHPELIGTVAVPGISEPFQTTREGIAAIARKYVSATWEAGLIFKHIKRRKGTRNFLAEVSMDETDSPQTPPELLVILALLADAGVYLHTIAPKFTGRFNKGVDYVGDLAQFEREFNDDLAVIAFAVKSYGLPRALKLSVHSGSDKFSLYPIIRRALQRTGAGVHLKTAGTTWLEELIGLAEAGGDGLALAKEIYAYALAHVDELCAPYASVIDIDRAKLPTVEAVNGWTGAQFANALRHISGHAEFNPHLRQLLHVSFKVAAQAGARYTGLLKANETVVAKNVTENLFDRHIKPLFIG